MTLVDLSKDQKAKIVSLPKNDAVAAQLLEQGFYPSCEVALAHKALFSGPMAFRLHNTKIMLQQHLAKQVIVSID